MDENVPDRLLFELDVRNIGISDNGDEAELSEADVEKEFFESSDIADEEYVAHFEFLLEFDPEFTATGKYYEINETVVLEKQKIIIRDVEIFPTHMRVNVEDMPENTAWLKSLEFYIETDDGMKFEPVSGGITATGSEDTPTMVSFRADSSYFYEAENLKLVITGAEWLRKDMEKVYINLKTGETGELPEGVEFYSAEKTERGWILEPRSVQRKTGHHHQILSHLYYDTEENEYEILSRTSSQEDSMDESEIGYIIEAVPLKDYYEDEVWVCPLYSHIWKAKEPVEVVIQ